MTGSRASLLNLLAAALVGAGLAIAGYFIGNFIGKGFVDARALERTVVVKGLAEREVPADTAIWPIQIIDAHNDVTTLLERIDQQTAKVSAFLAQQGFAADNVTVGAPNITDKQAQNYGNTNVPLRYSATRVITVFARNVDAVRSASTNLIDLGKEGVVFSQNSYEFRPQFLFGGLNDIKPEMVETATKNAREVAEKFAADSNSRLGKIKSARQGQFSIADRDSNNPQIKLVRVVSTLEYYLAD